MTHLEAIETLLDNPDSESRQEWENSSDARAIANQVIRYWVDHGLSQRDLAAKLGVSVSLVGRLELGEHEPRLSTLQLLTCRLGIWFNIIDIHQEGTMGRLSGDERRVERGVSRGLGTLVYTD